MGLASGPYSAQIQRALAAFAVNPPPFGPGPTTFTGQILAADGTAGAPSIAFASAPTYGLFFDTNTIRMSMAGTRKHIWDATSYSVADDAGAIKFGNSLDVILTRDAANILAQRNGTSGQSFRVYNTYTDASNYEAARIGWIANVLHIGATNAGTGTARTLQLQGAWNIASSGHLTAVADNTYDFGASGGNRPRNIYFGSDLVGQGGSIINFTGRGKIGSAGDGIITLYDQATTSFSRLQFGGTTSAFPSLARNGTWIDVKFADDSGRSPIGAQQVIVDDGTTAPTATAGRAKIYVDTADGDLKVIFGDGTIKTLATDT